MNISQFKLFVTNLFKSLISKCDAQAKADAATIAQLSADISTLTGTVKDLESALATSKDEAAKAIVSQVMAQADALNELSSELEATFNPSPVADAVADAVQESPEVVTPVEVINAETIGEPVATATEVSDAAVASIGDAAE